MADFVDQTGRTISLNQTPQRIISVVPSQTELLFDLGLNEEVIGITIDLIKLIRRNIICRIDFITDCRISH